MLKGSLFIDLRYNDMNTTVVSLFEKLAVNHPHLQFVLAKPKVVKIMSYVRPPASSPKKKFEI
jgi:hypothetical protein